MTNLHRKLKVAWLSARIRYHRIVMDSEQGITSQWKRHARTHTALCRMRGELMSPAERRAIERREGLA